MLAWLRSKRIHWISLCTACSLIMLLTAGCGTKDIDKRLFVIAVGVDKNENENEEKPYKITLKIPIPTNTKATQSPQFLYLTETASSISEALHMFTTQVDKNIEYTHTKLIVFGENILDQDLRVVTDVFLRRRDFQQTAWIAISRPSAEAILNTTFSGDTSNNILFNRFSNIGTESSFIVSIFLFDFRRQLGENGIDPVLPVIEVNKQNNSLMINKSITTSRNNEIIELNSEQTKIYNMIRNKLRKIYFDVYVEKEQQTFTVLVDNVDTNFKILTSNDGPPTIKMKVKMSGTIEESTEQVFNGELLKFNKLTSEVVKKKIDDLVKLLQKNEIDPIGFGLRYEATRMHTRDLATEWKELYPEIKFEVAVHVNIKSLGSIQ